MFRKKVDFGEKLLQRGRYEKIYYLQKKIPYPLTPEK